MKARAVVSTIAFVACSKQKGDRHSLARDLYTSPLFRMSLAYAEHVLKARTFILSAQHGLVEPDDGLDPYDLALEELEPWERADWGHVVSVQLARVIGEPAWHPHRFVCLAGALYVDYLEVNLREFQPGLTLERPLGGLQVGQRLAWLRDNLASVPREVWDRRAA